MLPPMHGRQNSVRVFSCELLRYKVKLSVESAMSRLKWLFPDTIMY